MALDGLFLYSIDKELKEFIGCKIDKVNQPEKDEIILTIRGNKTSKKLLISASANYPRIHFTDKSKPNPMKAPMFCMILRKYLSSGRITDIRQLGMDRIIVLDFENVDELGFDSKYSLIVEIMGRHSNITLIRQRDNQVMDSIKHITADINTYRNLYPGIEYIYPPESTKLDPLHFTLDNFTQFIDENEITISETIFSKMFTGISTPLSKELFYRLSKETNLDSYTTLETFNFISTFFDEVKNSNFSFAYYIDKKGTVKDFHCVSLSILNEECTYKTYTSPSNLLEDFYYEKDKNDRLKGRSSDLQKLIHTNIERCKKKIDILNKTLDKCASKDKYRLYGELLTANIYAIKKGDKSISVINYYSECGEHIEIELDPNKTPSENIQTLFKKYNKLKISEEMGKIQLISGKDEMDYLESVITNIENAESYTEIDEIKDELIETGYSKFKNNSKNKGKFKNKKNKESKPMHFTSSDGCDIYVGKNNIQNDYLTLKFAKKNDIWLHTKDVHGSHVIIKNEGNITDISLEEAAAIAAYYSKGKNSSKVAVDYTEIKNVKKPSGAKPGMVIYYTNKTIYINPQLAGRRVNS